MWAVNGTEISMAVGDYGIDLPITISGVTIDSYDELRLVINRAADNATVLEKTFSGIQQNTVNLELTEEESTGIPVGKYEYSLDWYQNGVFMCNIIPRSAFRVVSKVGS